MSQTYGHVIWRLWLWRRLRLSRSKHTAVTHSHLQGARAGPHLRFPVGHGSCSKCQMTLKGRLQGRTPGRFLLAELQGRSEGNWWGNEAWCNLLQECLQPAYVWLEMLRLEPDVLLSKKKKKKATNPDIFHRLGTNKQNHGCVTSNWMQQVTECCCSEVVSLYKQQKKRQKEIFLDLKCDRLCVSFFFFNFFCLLL